MTLDLEQYINETVRVCSWGRRFIAFNDYDVRIGHFSAESLDVLMYCIVLIRARPKQPSYLHKHLPPKHYECDFKFTWNIKTGQFFYCLTSHILTHSLQSTSRIFCTPAHSPRISPLTSQMFTNSPRSPLFSYSSSQHLKPFHFPLL